ncbi:MAG: hypothetical protein HFI38_03750 [Lachnospiraceae bacterium]|jgi:hypothetical protein|nr:hypothetical protein [Lachnospiraceae bacterium]
MKYIAFMAAALVFLYIRYRIGVRRSRASWEERLKTQWGQAPDRQYADGDMKRISRYYQMFRDGDSEIDEITWNDLGMDDIFKLVNHTRSSIGEEALYRMLRLPVCREEVLRERSRLADLFSGDRQLALEMEKQFSLIGKNGRQALCDYIAGLNDQPCRSNGVHYLGIAALAAAACVFFVSAGAGVMSVVAVLVFQMVTYYRDKAQMEAWFSSVAKVVGLVCSGEAICRLPGTEALSSYVGPLKEQVELLDPVRKRGSLIAMGNAMGGSPLDLIADYMKMLIHTDLIAYNQIIRLVREREAAIWRAVEILGQLECGLAVASFREYLGTWCRPVLTAEDAQERLSLCAEELYHPLIRNPVPNTVQAYRCQLITGSNASGKSTFLKTVAVNAVLAQTIYTVAGKSYEAPFYQICSSMALTDNLMGGESYYMAEIRSLKRILDRGHDRLPVLCFVDEVLRGTNTVERIAASSWILRSMADMNILCFAATHDRELTVLLESWYENGHFEEEITDGDILFSYRLYPGRAAGRNALRLLGLMGYDGEVLARAASMAKRFDRDGIWSMDDES